MRSAFSIGCDLGRTLKDSRGRVHRLLTIDEGPVGIQKVIHAGRGNDPEHLEQMRTALGEKMREQNEGSEADGQSHQ